MASRVSLRRSHLALGAGLVAVVVFALLGQTVGIYDAGLLTTAFIFGIVAISLDLVWGYTGIPDLGHALWFGVGALTVGIVTTTTDAEGLVSTVHSEPVRYLLGMVLGVAVAALLAGAVGRFSFSVKGSAFYIAVVTLALSTAVATLYSQFPRLTGGDNGLFGFQVPGVSTTAWYYVALVALVVVTVGAVVFVRSDAGLVLKAVRDNETRARYMGYDVERVKTLTFMLGAALSAFAGGLYALINGLVSADLFSFLFATQMLVWVAVGGRSTIIGAVIGAVGLQLAGARLTATFPTQWALFEGLLFVLVVVFLPDGVLPTVNRLLSRVINRFTVSTSDRALVMDTSPPPERPVTTPVISCRNLEFGYGALRVLRGVDLDVRRAELLCIVGPNGAGKSTLLSAIADGSLPISGEVRFELGPHASHRRRPPHRIARYGVSRKFQAPQLFSTLTVAETILLARRNVRLTSFWRRSREVAVGPSALDVIEATGLDGRDNELSTRLAHGLKQGVEIASSVAARPQVLLLDEPTAGLTTTERQVIGSVLRRLVAHGMTVVLIEHDLDFVNQIADRIVVLHSGRIIEDGTPAEVSASAVVREAYLGTVTSAA
jgi:branched-chain amino acid transport system permease protein